MTFWDDLQLRNRLPIASCLDVAVFRHLADAHVLRDEGVIGRLCTFRRLLRQRAFLHRSHEPCLRHDGTADRRLLAGDAAARDAQTRLDHSFTLRQSASSPIWEVDFSRLLASTPCSVAVPLGLLLAELVGNPALLGPFRPAAYVVPYLFLLLPNAFVATAVPVFDGGAQPACHGELPRRRGSGRSLCVQLVLGGHAWGQWETGEVARSSGCERATRVS